MKKIRFQEINCGKYDGAFEFEDLDGSITIIYKNTKQYLIAETKYINWYKKHMDNITKGRK